MDVHEGERAGAVCECGDVLPVHDTEFCSACGKVPLCLVCTARDRFPQCRACREEERDASQDENTPVSEDDVGPQSDEEGVTLPPADWTERHRCSVCDELHPAQCRQCRKLFCEKCLDATRQHSCMRCFEHGCPVRAVRHCKCQFCHGFPFCDSCMKRRHNSYQCSGCRMIVNKSGADRFRCPVPNCERVYGCHYCSSFGDVICCFEHSALCPICDQQFPMARNFVVRLNRTRRVEWKTCCGLCFLPVRALVECLLLRPGPRLPRELIEMITARVLDSRVKRDK
jgi:hypothetical protein